MKARSPEREDAREVQGDRQESFDRLVAVVYGRLRAVAHRQIGARGRGGSLDTTGLVHEAYLKLAHSPGLDANDAAHLVAKAALAMRHILVNRALARASAKRGGGWRAMACDEEGIASDEHPELLLEIHDALARLAAVEPRLARVVEYRFFGGLSEGEVAAALGVTVRTVQRDWVKARMLLQRALEG